MKIIETLTALLAYTQAANLKAQTEAMVEAGLQSQTQAELETSVEASATAEWGVFNSVVQGLVGAAGVRPATPPQPSQAAINARNEAVRQMKETLKENAQNQFDTYIKAYDKTYNQALTKYEIEIDNMMNSYNAMVAEREAKYNENYKNALDKSREVKAEKVAKKTEKCLNAENPIGHLSTRVVGTEGQTIDENYSANRFAIYEHRKMYEFFFLLDPQNFNVSDINNVIQHCVEADCLHPCYGASHEFSCNQCSNGFNHFLNLKQNDQVNDDELQEYITILKETCNKCQVPHTEEIVIPETKPIEQTQYKYPLLDIPPLTAYYPGLTRTPYDFVGDMQAELYRKWARIDAINPNDASGFMDDIGSNNINDWSAVTGYFESFGG